MLLDYFKLAEEPFGVTPDSRFLYLGRQHREALASLIYGIESNRGFLALIAKPGMGKTTMLYHCMNSLRGRARIAFVFRTDCDSREFIRHVLLDLGVDATGKDLPAMHEALNKVLTEEMQAGRRFILVIDEAQNLEEKVLESVRLLSNFETPWMKLMQIVIAGQPGLAEKLSRPSMTQLRQRISLVIRVAPFDWEEINAYIDHRLSIAGCKEPGLFTAGARRLIAEHSEGVPRTINNICFNAMSLACALKRKAIDDATVLEVLADLDLESLIEKPSPAPGPREEKPIQATSTAQRPRGSRLPLNWEEINAYIDHRLSMAGCTDPGRLFTAEARRLIAKHSEGVPGKINNICSKAISRACALERETVDGATVLEVVADLDLESLIEKPSPVTGTRKEGPVQATATPQQRRDRQKPKQSLQGLILSLAIVGVLVLGAVTGANKGGARASNIGAKTDNPTLQQVPSPAQIPTSPEAIEPSRGGNPRSVSVSQGKAVYLYQICVAKFGRYDQAILAEVRSLNLWSSDDSKQIPAGKEILIPSAPLLPASQELRPFPREVGKK
jgi:type II secretory pathway predicted ATPase ExeA